MYVATHIFTHLPIYLPINLFIHQSIFPFTYLPVCVAKLSSCAELIMSYGFYILFVGICWDSFCMESALHKAPVCTDNTNKHSAMYACPDYGFCVFSDELPVLSL